MGKAIHVIGTDTGVGKTAVACALARAFRAAYKDVGVCKPFASGTDPRQVPPDARFLVKAAASLDDPALVAPVRFALAACPFAAAAAARVNPGAGSALAAVSNLKAKHEILLVEGIGGLLVPIADGSTYLDFLERAGGRVLIVARAGLGTINHTLLTLNALRSRSIPVAGVILNKTSMDADPSEESNPEVIMRFGQVAVLAILPFMSKPEQELVIQDVSVLESLVSR